ncbi:protease inhibitor I42 family protein [Nocardia halotolerans]|uniref:Protease inhibitor I42 family protein n=1 Tax=Nocardia halotolerans TaxID=1755878 RepID=A0ABV8VG91_9NOCA
MRKFLLVGLAVAGLAAGCGDDEPAPDRVTSTTLTLPDPTPASTEPPVTVDQSAGGGSVELKVGQQLRVRLPRDPASNREWEPVNLDDGILVVGKPEADDATTVWPLRAVAPGTTTVEFAYGRSVEPPVEPQSTFLLEVRVS